MRHSQLTLIGFMVTAGLIYGSTLTGCDGDIGASTAKNAPSFGDTAIVAVGTSPGRSANDDGVAHYQEKRWNEAEQQFRKAAEIDPQSAEAHYNLGLTLDKMGDHEAAAESFKKVVVLAPKSSPLRASVILKEHVGQ
jgi:Flp pilus assembly protein TadD